MTTSDNVKNRTKEIKIRMNTCELLELDKLRGSQTRAKYIRTRALSKQGQPRKNQELALALARIGNNLNQIARVLNLQNTQGDVVNLAQCYLELHKIETMMNELWQEV